MSNITIPWKELNPQTLRAVIEEFVLRHGTDYGVEEVSLESKVEDVVRLLKSRKAEIVFDPETESCTINLTP